VKIAEGCDRRCGFCAIPSFRGDQRSRSVEEILTEARALHEGGVRELVLIAQDLASWATIGVAPAVARPSKYWTRAHAAAHRTDQDLEQRVDRVRLLYLYRQGSRAD